MKPYRLVILELECILKEVSNITKQTHFCFNEKKKFSLYENVC